MKVTLVQTAIAWENPEKNRDALSLNLIKNVRQTDLIILPEMFTTGFTFKTKKFAETFEGDTLVWMLNTALEFDAAVCGSIIFEEDKKYYNRLIWVQPDGKIFFYNKKHLFTYAGENKHFESGDERVIIKYSCKKENWSINPLICYDLRFPVWSSWRGDYELLIYSANWPEKRSYAWKSLLVSRAIENQSYVIGVNRIGTDGNGIYYSGDSSVIAPDGKTLFSVCEKEAVVTLEISQAEVLDTRKKFPFLKDRDPFILT